MERSSGTFWLSVWAFVVLADFPVLRAHSGDLFKVDEEEVSAFAKVSEYVPFCDARLTPVPKKRTLTVLPTSEEVVNMLENLANSGLRTLFLIDYDATLAKGDGWEVPGIRFDKNGVWQPRCPNFYDFFKKMREKNPDYVKILSAGGLFFHEREHYAPNTGSLNLVPLGDYLHYCEGLGFCALPPDPKNNTGICKGLQVASIIEHLKLKVDQVVFIDDHLSYARGVIDHAQGDFEVVSIHWPPKTE